MGEEQTRQLARSAFDSFSESKVENHRGMSFGGAGASLAILLLFPQSDRSSLALSMAFVCAVLALPLWVLKGTIFEYMLHVGESTYGFLRTPIAHRYLGLVEIAACSLLVLSMTALIFHTSPILATAFLVLTFAAMVVFNRFVSHLAEWVYEQKK